MKGLDFLVAFPTVHVDSLPLFAILHPREPVNLELVFVSFPFVDGHGFGFLLPGASRAQAACRFVTGVKNQFAF